MRENKFRAWDISHKIMIDHNDIEYLDFRDGSINYRFYIGDGEATQETITEPMSDFELMQYIGRTDSNGNEICEGDLFTIDFHWDMYKVVYDARKACYGLQGCKGAPFLSFVEIDKREYELTAILGNMYTDSELTEVHDVS